MKKILVLSESLRINETSSGIVSSTTIATLADAGYDVFVLSVRDFSYPVTWLPDSVKVRLFEAPETAKPFFYGIPKLRALRAHYFGVGDSDFELFKRWKDQIAKAISDFNPDYLFVLGSGLSFIPHFAVEALNIKVPIVCNFHDPFPQFAYPVPYKKSKTLLQRVQCWKMNALISKSVSVTFPSSLLGEQMGEIYSELRDKTVILPHIGRHLDGLPAGEADHQVSLEEGKLNILHIGTLLGPRDPRTLIRAFDELSERDPWVKDNVHMLFVGRVSQDQSLQSVYGNVKVIDQRVSYRKSLELMKKASALMIIEAESDCSPFMPGKLADIGHNEKPWISLTPINSEIVRIMGEDFPLRTELNNSEGISTVLRKLIAFLRGEQIYRFPYERLRHHVSSDRAGEIFREIFI